MGPQPLWKYGQPWFEVIIPCGCVQLFRGEEGEPVGKTLAWGSWPSFYSGLYIPGETLEKSIETFCFSFYNVQGETYLYQMLWPPGRWFGCMFKVMFQNRTEAQLVAQGPVLVSFFTVDQGWIQTCDPKVKESTLSGLG